MKHSQAEILCVLFYLRFLFLVQKLGVLKLPPSLLLSLVTLLHLALVLLYI